MHETTQRGPLAVNAGTYGAPGMGGLHRYTGEVLDRLVRAEPELVIFAGDQSEADRWPGNMRRVRPGSFSRASFSGNLTRLVWHQTLLPGALRRMGARAYYSPFPEGMMRPVCPQVVTVHDVIPLRYPESLPRQAHYYRYVLPPMLRASSAVIATSQSTANDLREYFGVRVPIHVVYQGYRAEMFRPPLPGEGPGGAVRELGDYLLTVAEDRPYKNLEGLIHAFARAGVPGVRLALAGKMENAELLALPARLGIADRVSFMGAVSDELLGELYRNALGFIFPSRWEGFGIPPLEAMASGCPVAASSAASIPEVCGDAALYFDPDDADAMAGSITRLAGDGALRAELAARGVERARRFSYTRCAEEIVEVIRSVTGELPDAAGARPSPARRLRPAGRSST